MCLLVVTLSPHRPSTKRLSGRRPARLGSGHERAGHRSDRLRADLLTVLSADLEAGEARQAVGRPLDDLGDGLLVVLREFLVEQRTCLEERVDATLDDLREGGLGLALAWREISLTISRSLATSAGTSSRDR